MNIIAIFKELTQDRMLSLLMAGYVLLVIVLFVLSVLNIKPSDLQIHTRYTSFGVTHFYTDQWLYLFNFLVFNIIFSFFYLIISIKAFFVRGLGAARALVALGIVMLTTALIYQLVIFKIVGFSR